MNKAVPLPIKSNISIGDCLRFRTISEPAEVERDASTFDDTSLNRKGYLVLRRIPRDGLIKRLVANPSNVTSPQATSPLLEGIRSKCSRFCLPLESSQFNIQQSVKVLEDKASFFEGQLNPLHYENQLLKEQIIAMNRMITRTEIIYTVKTDELRKLLSPIERNGRNRQLEIETASMEDICELIKKDWWQLVEDNRKLH
ncbi:unnamed protein product [Sphagnum jensenii]